MIDLITTVWEASPVFALLSMMAATVTGACLIWGYWYRRGMFKRLPRVSGDHSVMTDRPRDPCVSCTENHCDACRLRSQYETVYSDWHRKGEAYEQSQVDALEEIEGISTPGGY